MEAILERQQQQLAEERAAMHAASAKIEALVLEARDMEREHSEALQGQVRQQEAMVAMQFVTVQERLGRLETLFEAMPGELTRMEAILERQQQQQVEERDTTVASLREVVDQLRVAVEQLTSASSSTTTAPSSTTTVTTTESFNVVDFTDE